MLTILYVHSNALLPLSNKEAYKTEKSMTSYNSKKLDSQHRNSSQQFMNQARTISRWVSIVNSSKLK